MNLDGKLRTALHGAVMIAVIFAAAWMWELRCLTREGRTSQAMVAADAHNLAVASIAEVSNARADFGGFARVATDKVSGIGEDFRRNLDILGGSQNELRHLIGDPHKRTGFFETQDRLNAMLGDPQQRTGFFETQDKFSALFGDPTRKSGFFATLDNLDQLLAPGKSFVDHGDSFVVGPVFQRLTVSSADLLDHSAGIAGNVEVWTKKTLNPAPYQGDHPRLHKFGAVSFGAIKMLPYVADGVRTANAGK
jgi:hypothetical protein